MTLVAGLDHVLLAAPRGAEPTARAFFGDVLGLEEIEKPATLAARGGVWFACGDQQLHIGIEDDFVPAQKAHPAFAVEGAEALRARLVEAGHPAEDDDAIPSVRRFYAADPFGNRLEFVEAAR